jgi:hypothetical protein
MGFALHGVDEGVDTLDHEGSPQVRLTAASLPAQHHYPRHDSALRLRSLQRVARQPLGLKVI